MDTKIYRIAEAIIKGGKNIFFTGAGISSESGIQDYRGTKGLWKKNRPIYFNDFMTSRKAREEYWRRKIVFFNELEQAVPNAAHSSLYSLYRMGLVEVIITQNIDGLHHKSGVPADKIIEIHGNTTRIKCMACGELFSLEDIKQRIQSGEDAPECHCGGYLKPDTVSFGQSLRLDDVKRAFYYARNCRTFCVIGSTILVQPAAQMPHYAKNNGAFLAIINLSETPCDNICDVLIRSQAGTVLKKIVEQVSAFIAETR